MAAYEFTVASSVLMDLGLPPVPLVAEEERILWSSGEITGGALNNSISIFVKYEAIVPDTAVVSPFSFEIVATVETKNADNTWSEIARQNTPIRKLRQGAKREILITPAGGSGDEGIDTVIAGFKGIPLKLKSVYAGSGEGIFRVCVSVVDETPTGANPFESVTVSISGKRYDA